MKGNLDIDDWRAPRSRSTRRRLLAPWLSMAVGALAGCQSGRTPPPTSASSPAPTAPTMSACRARLPRLQQQYPALRQLTRDADPRSSASAPAPATTVNAPQQGVMLAMGPGGMVKAIGPGAMVKAPRQAIRVALEEGEDPGCAPDECNGNSAFMNGYHVDELHLDPTRANKGATNHNGVEIIDFTPPPSEPPTRWVLSADDGELVATRSSTGSQLRGAQLVGSKIRLEYTGGPHAGEEDVIVIHSYDDSAMTWTPNPVVIHRYLLTYAPKKYGFTRDDESGCFTVPICAVAAHTGDEKLAWTAVVSGERYTHDAVTHLPQPESAGSEPGWFNLACQGNALYKAKMLGYDPMPVPEAMSVLPNAGLDNTDARQATLKMITADYCGNNQSFTENGTYVRWANRAAEEGEDDDNAKIDNGPRLAEDDCQAPETMNESDVEAIWGPEGAMCLRHSDSGPLRHVDKDKVPCGGQLPSCSGFTPQEPWYWKTYVCDP